MKNRYNQRQSWFQFVSKALGHSPRLRPFMGGVALVLILSAALAGCSDAPLEERANLGEKCSTTKESCSVGTCVSIESKGTTGVCQVTGCHDASDCRDHYGNDAVCYHTISRSFCTTRCQKVSDCGENFFCDSAGAEPVCTPKKDSLTTKRVVRSEYNCFDVKHGEVSKITFTIPMNSKGFAVNVYSPEGIPLMPKYFEAGGTKYPYLTQNDLEHTPFFYMVMTNFLNMGANVLFFPMSPLARDTFMLVDKEERTITYAFSALKKDGTVCYTTINKKSLGKTLDLNFYFVNPILEISATEKVLLTAENAKDSEIFQRVVERVRKIYAQQNIELGKIHYYNSPKKVVGKYSDLVINKTSEGIDFSPIYNLMATSVDHGDSLNDRLSVNVFLVHTITSTDGIIGISSGAPGAIALNGTTKSGVVFSLQDAGGMTEDTLTKLPVNGADFVGNTMAHEIGHYLGLVHTTELQINREDPLDDTPVCSRLFKRAGKWSQCEDFNNLMFPAAGLEHTKLTKQQGDVMKANPFLK